MCMKKVVICTKLNERKLTKFAQRFVCILARRRERIVVRDASWLLCNTREFRFVSEVQ
jgi:hypothetical protein